MCSGMSKKHRVERQSDSHAKAWARRSTVLKHTTCLCLLMVMIAMTPGRLASQSVERLQARADSLLREWRRANALADMVDSLNQTRAAVYVQLVTAPSQAARSCFLGVISDCRNALALGESPDPLQQWYPSAGERRALVFRSFAEYFGYSDHGARKPALQSCGAGSDSACTELLRSLPPGALPRPLTYDARAALAHIALRLGGREAYHRLVARPGAPIADRLAGAAGVSVDSLVAQWRSEILAARPAPVTLPPWGPWAALGWTAVFAVCALRSSRWRVS